MQTEAEAKAVRAIEDLWKTRSAIDFSQRGHLTADVRIVSLAQWGEIQTALGTVGNVTGTTVTAMDMNYARINIAYLGGLDQLREAMGGAGLRVQDAFGDAVGVRAWLAETASRGDWAPR